MCPQQCENLTLQPKPKEDVRIGLPWAVWDRICSLDPCAALSPSAGKGLRAEGMMHWDIKGWINLGAEHRGPVRGSQSCPVNKPRELGFPDSSPNSLLTLLMCLLCPGLYFGIPAGQGMPVAHQGWGCRGSLGLSAPLAPPGQEGGSGDALPGPASQ